MMREQEPSGFLQRTAAAWNNFFFRPGDPTTLGLMRIITGVVIVYVHLAYTRDLENFFGKDGWADQQLADRTRHEYPIFMNSFEWNEPITNYVAPNDPELRAIFHRWIMSLPENVEQRREVLSYLGVLPPDYSDSGEGLALAERLLIKPMADTPRPRRDQFVLVAPSERQQRLDALTRDQVAPAEEALLPRFMRNQSKAIREDYRRKVVKFVDSFPRNPSDVALIFYHLNTQATVPLNVVDERLPRTELQRTHRFLTGSDDIKDPAQGAPFLPSELSKRQDVLDYMNYWGVDKRRAWTLGLYTWSIWHHVTNPTMMYTIHFVIIGAMALFALGLWTRITSVLAWMGALCYIHRTTQILFGMDTMMNLCLLYLMIGPSGAALSLDRWREKRRAQRELERLRRENKDTREVEAILAGPRPSVMANFVTRLVQIHFCFIYAASGLSKLKGPAWWGHTAIWSTMANPEFSPTVFGPWRWFISFLSDHRWVTELIMSFGAIYTLALEIALPFLIWRPKLRPYMVGAGILLHAGIAIVMGLTVFGLLMMTLLMSYIPPATVRRWLATGESSDEPAQSTPTPSARKPVAV